VRLPRFRIAWAMTIVAVVAIDFAILRAMLDHPELSLAVLGFLPMVSVLVVLKLIGQQRPQSRPFLMGFETFGVAALVLFLVLIAAPPGHRLIGSYLALSVLSLERIVGPDQPLLYDQIAYFVIAVMLGWPQVTFAMLGGLLSRRYKVTSGRR
jgi:hypothetical protein